MFEWLNNYLARKSLELYKRHLDSLPEMLKEELEMSIRRKTKGMADEKKRVFLQKRGGRINDVCMRIYEQEEENTRREIDLIRDISSGIA